MAITSNSSFWCRSRGRRAMIRRVGKAIAAGGACPPAARTGVCDGGHGAHETVDGGERRRLAPLPTLRISYLAAAIVLAVVAIPALAAPKLFESTQVTPSGEYTFGIEGPAVDRDGNVFVVNFGRAGT